MEKSISLNFKKNSLLSSVYGEKNANLNLISKLLGVKISSRGSFVAIAGEEEKLELASRLLKSLYSLAENGSESFDRTEIEVILQRLSKTRDAHDDSSTNSHVLYTKKKTVFPYNQAQHDFIQQIMDKDVVFGIGVAGTGKTFLAVAVAVSMFLEKKVKKIILARPAVEAGEKLGFLPGEIREKVDPYLQPLYDSLYEMLPSESIERYIVTKEIQIAPLAFMRGRTLEGAFVILDEGQNTTVTQMKMFLTRLGMGSKMVITGDITQIDLPNGVQSGLVDAVERFRSLKSEIGVTTFTSADVVRHPLTKKIIDAYAKK